MTEPRWNPNLQKPLTWVLLLNLFVIGLISFVLYRSYQQDRDKAILVADNLSRVLDENLSRFIDKVDLTLLAVVDEIQREEQSGGIDRPTLESFLARHDSRLPEAVGLRVSDASGRIDYAVSNITAPQGSAADREYFQRLRDDPSIDLYISKPIVGRLVAKPIIVLARRRHSGDGSFAGIVHLSVGLDALSATLSSVDLGPHGNVNLWDGNLELLARYSPVPPPPGVSGNVAPSSSLRELIQRNAPPTAYHVRSVIDGIDRLFFFRKVSRWPLYLILGVADVDFRSGWWREAVTLGSLASLFMLASSVAALMIQRTMRALEQARFEAEHARRHSDLILASAGEGICGIDTAGKVMFINPSARRMLGWTGETAGLGENFHLATHHHHPDGRVYPAEDCPMSRMLTGPGAAATPIRVRDEVYWRRDGTSFPVEYALTPMINDSGVAGVVAVFHDITERKQAEDEIHALLAKTQALLTNTPIGIAIVGLDRRIIETNPAFLRTFGLAAEALAGQPTRRFYRTDEDYEELGRRAYPAISQGKLFRDDVLMQRGDGADIWIRLVAHLVDDRNPALGVVWAFEDITERMAMEQELTRSNKELEQFAYVASHDLRQPLRMVTSYLGLIAKELGPRLEGEEKTFIGFAMDGARRMDRMITDLLDYSRIGRGSQEKAAVSLDDALFLAQSNLQAAIAEAAATVTVEDALPTVTGYESELVRLFQNLIANAIKFHRPEQSPRLTIRCRETPRNWIIACTDNGIGIALENQDRLFVIFQRLVPREQYEGTGIGLATCRKICDHHGGRIWVESEPGKGSTFFVALPKG